VQRPALNLLNGYDKHISSKILLLRGMDSWSPYFDSEITPEGFTGLHGAAYFGFVEIIVVLLAIDKWDVEATDFQGNKAISEAARRGHEAAVKALLEPNDINPDLASTRNQTPFSLATNNRGISQRESWLILACRDSNGSQVRAHVSLKR